jgi:hypothetical protein
VSSRRFSNSFLHEASITDLSGEKRIGRDTIPKALGALEAAGLTKIVRPFGPGQKGEVEILVWDRLIVGTTGQKIAEKSANSVGRTEQKIADRSRTDRGQIADGSRRSPRTTREKRGP